MQREDPPHLLGDGDVEGCQVNVLDPMKARSRAYENPLLGRPGAGLIYGLFAGWSSALAPRQRHRRQQLLLPPPPPPAPDTPHSSLLSHCFIYSWLTCSRGSAPPFWGVQISSTSAIRISRKGWHMLLNFCFHTALTFAVFAGGINRIKYPIICQAVFRIKHRLEQSILHCQLTSAGVHLPGAHKYTLSLRQRELQGALKLGLAALAALQAAPAQLPLNTSTCTPILIFPLSISLALRPCPPLYCRYAASNVGVVLHYSSLSTMLWLGVTARNIYKQVTKKPLQSQDGDPPPPPKQPLLR
ncbi:hypothetical protein NQZ68_012543 [Dissostichus eleginoides]|nr:hypothetical protein NQZ68_012543 [Dissostichus eleginoides]